jgi:hypothetical protein
MAVLRPRTVKRNRSYLQVGAAGRQQDPVGLESLALATQGDVDKDFRN